MSCCTDRAMWQHRSSSISSPLQWVFSANARAAVDAEPVTRCRSPLTWPVVFPLRTRARRNKAPARAPVGTHRQKIPSLSCLEPIAAPRPRSWRSALARAALAHPPGKVACLGGKSDPHSALERLEGQRNLFESVAFPGLIVGMRPKSSGPGRSRNWRQ